MKIISIIMSLMALMLVSVSSWADECTEYKSLFSENEEDYMALFNVNMDKKEYYIIYYGKLRPARNISESTKQFKDIPLIKYPPNLKKVIDNYLELENENMLPFSWWTGPAGSTPVPSHCEAIQAGTSFRCTSKKMDVVGASTREEVTGLYDGNKVGFKAADPCIVSTSYWNFKGMVERGEADDKDGDGIPDSFAALPEDTAEPSEEIPSPTEPTEISAPLTAGEPQDVSPIVSRGFDEGGACDLIPTAVVNPFSFLLITAALGILVRRRRK